MEKKRGIIISSAILLFALLLLLFRVGGVSKKLDDQEDRLNKLETNLTKAISKITIESPNTGKGDEETLTAELIYNFSAYDNITDSIDVSFSVVPREVSKNLKVNLISNGDVINLERDSVIFQGKHKFSLNDKFLNLVTYDRDGIVTVDKLPDPKYNSLVGGLVLPKLSVENKKLEPILTEKTYEVNAISKFKLVDSLNEISHEDFGKKINFESLSMVIEVNGIEAKKQEFELFKHGFQEEYNEINLKADITKDDIVKLYVVAVDGFGLQHKVLLDVQNDPKTIIKKDMVNVFGKDKTKPVFEYEY